MASYDSQNLLPGSGGRTNGGNISVVSSRSGGGGEYFGALAILADGFLAPINKQFRSFGGVSPHATGRFYRHLEKL